MTRKRNILCIEGTARALSPIIHGGDKTGGTVNEFRREKMLVDGAFEGVPIVSANSIAGHLRDMCALWCLDQIDYGPIADLRVVDLLSGGGSLSKAKKSARYVDLFEEAELRTLFPVISLMGASVGNRILDGRLDVDAWVPVCVETRQRLPEWLWETAERYHIGDLLQILHFTRRDDKKRRVWQDYIDPDVLAAHQRQQANRAERGEAPRTGGEVMQMRYGFEALAAGTLFHVRFGLRNPTDVELGVFWGGLSYFYERPRIGGRTARGFGLVELDLKQYRLTGPARVEEPLALEAMDVASEHLVTHRDAIVRVLEGLS